MLTESSDVPEVLTAFVAFESDDDSMSMYVLAPLAELTSTSELVTLNRSERTMSR